MRLLIVEDNALMRGLIRSLVSDLAVIVDECSSGEEAVARYAETRPDCVLMDYEMGAMDGLTATAAIIAAHPAARIVLVTQYSDRYLREAARAAGVCGFVGKENLSAVREVIDRMM
ncbi:MAG: response regulator [Acidobacteria bacterium]|nr:response regulator [Acidobacteriota bacterium]